MPDLTTNDQFEGSEDSLNQQRMDALNTLATFGRRGLEQAVASRQADVNNQAAGGAAGVEYASMVGGDANFQKQLRDQAGAALKPYGQTDQRTVDMIGRENQATQSVNDNYFRQAAEAVPLYRQNAADITATYRAAYEDKQRQMQHQLAMEQEQRAQAAAMVAAARASIPVAAPVPTAAPAGLLGTVDTSSPVDYLTAAAIISQLQPGTPEYNAIVAQWPMLGNQPAAPGPVTRMGRAN